MASEICSDLAEIKLEVGKEEPEKPTIIKKSFSNSPMSFYEALIDRYLNADQFHLPKFVQFKAPPSINFESDGFKLGKLKTLGLDKKNIYKAGIPAEGLSSLCPNVTQLHLARNTLQHWTEIEAILREFPLLEECNLHNTCFTIRPENLAVIHPPVICPKLHTLDLAHTGVGWSEIKHIALQCPNISVLDLAGNSIDNISAEALNCIPNLVCLILSLNNIKSWEEVTKLGIMPNLETLQLSNNPLSLDNYSPALIPDTGPVNDNELVSKPTATPLFSSLTSLSLAAVNICKWHELDVIAELPALKHVRLRDIPLASEISQEDRRKIFLSSLPNIVKLNGSMFDGEERSKSERFTLRYFYPLDYNPQFIPRLIKKHGNLQPLVDIDISFGYKEIIEVEFVYKSKLWRRQKISVKQTVKELIFWLKKELQVPKNSFKVYLLPASAVGNDFEDMEELYMSSLPLSRFDIREGDKIMIV